MAAVDGAVKASEQYASSTQTAVSRVGRHFLSTSWDKAEETTIGHVTQFASGYSFSNSRQGKTHGDYPMYKVSDMNTLGNEIAMFAANNWITASDKTEMKCKTWPPGTVIFPKVGAALLTEKRRFLTQEAAFDNNVMGLIPTDKIAAEYLYLYMEHVKFADIAQSGAVPSINQSHVSSLPIRLPSIEEQASVIDVVSALRSAVVSASEMLSQYKSTRSHLLASLLSGHHRIPESYDELVELEPELASI